MSFFCVITCFVFFFCFFWLQWCCMTYLNTHYAPELSEMVQNITVRPLVVKWQSPFDHGKSDILEAALVSCLRNGFDPKYWIFLYFPVLFPESFLEISSSESDIFVEISVYAFWNGVEHHCATSDHEMTVSFWSWKIWYFVIFRDNLLISTVDSRIQSDPMDFFLIRQTALSPRVFGVWRTSGAWDVSRYSRIFFKVRSERLWCTLGCHHSRPAFERF